MAFQHALDTSCPQFQPISLVSFKSQHLLLNEIMGKNNSHNIESNHSVKGMMDAIEA